MQLPAAGLNQHQRPSKPTTPLGFENILLEAAGRHFIPTSILINSKFEIRHIHGDASRLLNVSPGKPAFDLISLIRRELRTEVQVLMRQAQVKQAVAHGRPRHIKALDPTRGVRLSVHPVFAPVTRRCSWSVSSGSLPPAGKNTVEDSNNVTDKELEDELAATREHLQTLVEELETSNEEMQALNEEIQASNEEMQASNEELEASNEELQSTNEELATVNEELQIKTAETQELNIELECIQNSVDYPLLVLDRNACLQRFNSAAARLFKLGAAQVGRHLRDLPSAAGHARSGRRQPAGDRHAECARPPDRQRQPPPLRTAHRAAAARRAAHRRRHPALCRQHQPLRGRALGARNAGQAARGDEQFGLADGGQGRFRTLPVRQPQVRADLRV
jgi:two-component system CheB/CheR fusion protein